MATNVAALSARRPPVHLIDSECDLLFDLALDTEGANGAVSAMLIGEIERAEIHLRSDIPADVVTLGSEVEFLDEGTHRLRKLQVVLPAEADIGQGRISVLTPVGAGLIGLRAGRCIDWPDREGRNHVLRILAVRQPAESAA